MSELLDFICKYDSRTLVKQGDYLTSTILIVDDNLSILKTLSKLLSERNYQVICCSHPEQAVNLLNDQIEIDAILLDIKMPNINGIELFKLFSKEWPDIPVIFFSAYQDIEDFSNNSDLQPYGYIEKGVWEDIERLYSLIKKATKKNVKTLAF